MNGYRVIKFILIRPKDDRIYNDIIVKSMSLCKDKRKIVSVWFVRKSYKL